MEQDVPRKQTHAIHIPEPRVNVVSLKDQIKQCNVGVTVLAQDNVQLRLVYRPSHQ